MSIYKRKVITGEYKMIKLCKTLIGIILYFGLTSLNAQAEIKLQYLAETAYQECGDLGNDALAIQSIRYEIDSSRQEILKTLDALVIQELGRQPLFMSRINAVATWVFRNYPSDFSPKLVGQTYAIECRIKTAQQIEHLLDHDGVLANHNNRTADINR